MREKERVGRLPQKRVNHIHYPLFSLFPTFITVNPDTPHGGLFEGGRVICQKAAWMGAYMKGLNRIIMACRLML